MPERLPGLQHPTRPAAPAPTPPRPACVPSSWPVDSAAVFKKAEPFAYSYVNDDETSVFTCSGECDYRITWGVSP